MLVFETLLLGLVFGTYPVRLAVSEPVAVVEIRLDDCTAGVLSSPPWELAVDFGPRPAPHVLEAIGRATDGRELARSRRWVNVPRTSAEAGISLERDPQGRVVAARIFWDDLVDPEPRSVGLELDGRAVAVDDPRRVPLPLADPGSVHLLSATVHLGSGRTASAATAFGGDLGDQAAVELTAVPVTVEGGAALPPIDRLSTWFEVAGRPARVVAVESAPSRLLVVPDLHLPRRSSRADRTARRSSGAFAPPGLRRSRMKRAGEGAAHRFAVLTPVPDRRSVRGEERRLFPASDEYRADPANFERLLGTLDLSSLPRSQQMLGNAVAVAGVEAAAGNRPRAVVLLLASGGCDLGTVDAESAAAFLAELHVPLRVWTRSPATPTCGWGAATDVSDTRKLRAAVGELVDQLASQHLVWIDGAHLPQSIRVAPGAPARIAR